MLPAIYGRYRGSYLERAIQQKDGSDPIESIFVDFLEDFASSIGVVFDSDGAHKVSIALHRMHDDLNERWLALRCTLHW